MRRRPLTVKRGCRGGRISFKKLIGQQHNSKYRLFFSRNQASLTLDLRDVDANKAAHCDSIAWLHGVTDAMMATSDRLRQF